MVTINSLENENEDISFRDPIDLICVMDKSNSMKRGRIDLVKAALIQLLELLGEKDRICLIEFGDNANRVCELKRVTK